MKRLKKLSTAPIVTGFLIIAAAANRMWEETARRQGITFYEVTGQETPAAQPRQSQSAADTLWAGIDAMIATFYRNRAAVLALA